MPSYRRAVLSVATLAALSSQAHAWTLGSELDHEGCHERITAAALRAARANFATAPMITPTRQEAALFDDVQWVPPTDLKRDVGAMALLLGVRDNDLKGENPLDSLRLVEVHGNPGTQQEHCIRGADDDGDAGNEAALAACRAFIVARATEALEGLGADGTVDGSIRMPLPVYVSIAGHVKPELPLFYVRMGQALHALEDGFTHTYRTADDGLEVSVVLNWIESVDGTPPNEDRDGPPHLPALDDCQSDDPVVRRNFALARTAATELLAYALDPSLTRDAKVAGFEQVVTAYLSFEPGCSASDDWCNAHEEKLASSSGCNASGSHGPTSLLLLLLAIGVVSRRARPYVVVAGLVLAVALVPPAVADEIPVPPSSTPRPPLPPPSSQPTTSPTTPAPAPVPTTPSATPDASATTTPDATPVAPIAAQPGQEEPGRDEKTPTAGEIQEVREDKKLGSKLGFAAMGGAGINHGGGAVALGIRYRLSEKWVIGLDGEWNPWVTPSPLDMKTGAANAYFTMIRRFPMKFDRVNLRSTLQLGASMLLFDVYGAEKYDIGPFAAFSPLGIDYDLGGSVRLVLDPIQIAVPVPHVGQIPLYYEQFRTMIGLQIGS